MVATLKVDEATWDTHRGDVASYLVGVAGKEFFDVKVSEVGTKGVLFAQVAYKPKAKKTAEPDSGAKPAEAKPEKKVEAKPAKKAKTVKE